MVEILAIFGREKLISPAPRKRRRRHVEPCRTWGLIELTRARNEQIRVNLNQTLRKNGVRRRVSGKHSQRTEVKYWLRERLHERGG